jgi:hypothetical protein
MIDVTNFHETPSMENLLDGTACRCSCTCSCGCTDACGSSNSASCSNGVSAGAPVAGVSAA